MRREINFMVIFQKLFSVNCSITKSVEDAKDAVKSGSFDYGYVYDPVFDFIPIHDCNRYAAPFSKNFWLLIGSCIWENTIARRSANKKRTFNNPQNVLRFKSFLEKECKITKLALTKQKTQKTS